MATMAPVRSGPRIEIARRNSSIATMVVITPWYTACKASIDQGAADRFLGSHSR